MNAEISITGATTLTANRRHVCSGTTADYTVPLPTLTSEDAGARVQVRIAAGLTKLVTVDAGSGVLIDGQQTRIMWANEVALLMWDGTTWAKVAGKSIPMQVTLSSSVVTALGGQGAYTTIPLNTVVSGLAAMLDVANTAVKILRGSSYLMRGEASTATASTVTTVARIYNQTTSAVMGTSSTTASYPTAIPNTFALVDSGAVLKLQSYCFTSGQSNYAGDNVRICEVPTW